MQPFINVVPFITVWLVKVLLSGLVYGYGIFKWKCGVLYLLVSYETCFEENEMLPLKKT